MEKIERQHRSVSVRIGNVRDVHRKRRIGNRKGRIKINMREKERDIVREREKDRER